MDLGRELENDGQRRRGCSLHRHARKVLPHVLPVSVAVLLPAGVDGHANVAAFDADDDLAVSKAVVGLRE